VISTLIGPGDPSGHSKQIRHWSLMRMNANAVLALAIPLQSFQLVARECRKVLQAVGSVQAIKSDLCLPCKTGEVLDVLPLGETLGTAVSVAYDHLHDLAYITRYVKRNGND
jgi:hypothetical protein